MALPIPRLHLFEIDDQPQFPADLRECVQSILTFFWNLHTPILQPCAPSTLVVRTLQNLLGRRLSEYTFVDFCAGAGGPTPAIERQVNDELMKDSDDDLDEVMSNTSVTRRLGKTRATKVKPGIHFVMTDIHPHLPAWKEACAGREYLKYVPTSVDAAQTSTNLLEMANLPMFGNTVAQEHNRPVFRLFCLAFHHLDDELAIRVLQNTLETSAGFAIFELQSRHLGDLFTVCMMAPMLFLGSWYWFRHSWRHLFWTYIIPVLPFVIVFDGLVSCLRTRRPHEIQQLLAEAVRRSNREGNVEKTSWHFESDSSLHTRPVGSMHYFAGIKTDRHNE